MDIRNKKKKQNFQLRVGGISAVGLGFLGQHLSIANQVAESKGVDAMSAFMQSLEQNPFSIFPLDHKYLIMTTLISVGLGFFVGLQYEEGELKRASNRDTALADSRFMDEIDLQNYNRRYSDPPNETSYNGPNNAIFTDKIRLNIDNKLTRRNLNTVVIGGSGAGKSRFFVGPNILQKNCSFAVTDPSGELLDDYGKYLENEGYDIKVLNLVDLAKSNTYNPLAYLRSEVDVKILIDTIVDNSGNGEGGGKGGDSEFWDNSMKALLQGLVFYSLACEPIEVQNLGHIMDLLQGTMIEDENSKVEPPTERKIMQLKKEIEMHPEKDKNGYMACAVKYYDIFRSAGGGKTRSNILLTCETKLQPFLMSEVRRLTGSNDIDLTRLSDRKTAIFIITSSSHNTFNFLSSVFYSQLFNYQYNYVENTVDLGYSLRNGKELLGVFKAENDKESEIAKEKANHYVNSVKSGATKVEYNEDKDIYEIVMYDDYYEHIENETRQLEEGIEELKKQVSEIKRIAPGECFEETSRIEKMEAENDRMKKRVVVAWRGSLEEAKKLKEQLEKNIRFEKCKKTLPIHFRFILDEFANIGQIGDFEKKLATIRKYEISVDIILQSVAQLKGMYKEDRWRGIIGNCDNILFLGSNDIDTLKFVSDLLGEKTVRIKNYSFNEQKVGSSVGVQKVPLMAPSQLAQMGDSECIYILRGNNEENNAMKEKTFWQKRKTPDIVSRNIYMGPKYEITKHPNYKKAHSCGKYHIFSAVTKQLEKIKREKENLDNILTRENYNEYLKREQEVYEVYIDQLLRKEKNKTEKIKSQNIINNKDENGNAIVSEEVTVEVSEKNMDMVERLGDFMETKADVDEFDEDWEDFDDWEDESIKEGKINLNKNETIYTDTEEDKEMFNQMVF